MDALISQTRQLAASADAEARRDLVDTFRQLLFEIESPEDTLHRLVFGHFQLAVVRAAQNSKLIDTLVHHERKPIETKRISDETGMSMLLLERLLRYMAAMGMVTQVSKDSYAANKNTEAFSQPGIRAGIGYGMNFASPSAQALPEYLSRYSYKCPDGLQDCPWHPVHDKEQNAMQFLFTHPAVLKEFNTFMTHQRLNSRVWLDVYPLDKSAEPDQGAFFVDIGGGLGHMCVELSRRHPSIPGRTVMQDLAPTISKLPAGQPFEPMVHNFYEEQPIKAARYYYFRNILHSLSDKDCRKVLERTRAALGPQSKILIDEMVMPSEKAHWRAVQLDILMMSVAGAIERTEEQWHALCNSVGLKLSNIYVYDSVQGDAVLEVVLQSDMTGSKARP